MGAQYFCSKTGQFLLCDPELIGKKATCSECGEEHDVVPTDDTTGSQAPASVPGESNQEQEKPKRVSKAGIIVAVILFLSGFSQFDGGMTLDKMNTVGCFWIVAIVLFIRSFFPPIRWWQGIMTFFGGAFIGVGVMKFLFERDPLVRLMTLGTGAIIGALLLFFAFKQFGKKSEAR